jgi:hypothetical protein
MPETDTLRPELTQPIPYRMQGLPIRRGYPVPWFVAKVDGEYDFRIADPKKWHRAVQDKLCWVCGSQLGKYIAFVVGPMCLVNRTSSEPPSHLDCAEWSAINCPFLARPHMERRDVSPEIEMSAPAGNMIMRNPGAVAVIQARKYSLFLDPKGKPLVHIGDPEAVNWYSKGRTATRAEVQESIDTGIPLLRATINSKEESEWLDKSLEQALRWLPKENR